jgi:hypothetical protein
MGVGRFGVLSIVNVLYINAAQVAYQSVELHCSDEKIKILFSS